MLGDNKAMASFSVDSIEEAEEFYGGTLGVRVEGDSGALWLHLTDGYDVLIYAKPDHIPASYTILNFVVEDIDEAVDRLRERGVRLLRYDMLGTDGRASFVALSARSPGLSIPLATTSQSLSSRHPSSRAEAPDGQRWLPEGAMAMEPEFRRVFVC